MKKTIFFHDGKKVKRFIGLGQAITMAQACYFKGIELGYDTIAVEWHNMVTYPYWTDQSTFGGLINNPCSGILPIKFVNKGAIVTPRADTIDISESDCIYDGSPPLIENPMDMHPSWSYLNKYYIDTGKRPIFNIKKTKKEPYLLFHYRNSSRAGHEKRNTPTKQWIDIFNRFKNAYGDKYRFEKIGEPSPIDDKFDKVHDYFPNNLQSMFDLTNNSSFFVGNESGPISLAYMFGIPSIVFYSNKAKVARNKNRKWGKEGYILYGNGPYDWVDDNIYYPIEFDEDRIDNEVINFGGKFL